MISCSRCDGCFRCSLPIVLVKIVMWGDLPCSYRYFERVLLDFDNSWCEYFGTVIKIFKITLMSNRLSTSPWISFHCTNFGKNFLPIHYYVFNYLSGKVGCGSNYMGFVEDERIFWTLTSMKMRLGN
jgi:hypothetical protein